MAMITLLLHLVSTALKLLVATVALLFAVYVVFMTVGVWRLNHYRVYVAGGAYLAPTQWSFYGDQGIAFFSPDGRMLAGPDVGWICIRGHTIEATAEGSGGTFVYHAGAESVVWNNEDWEGYMKILRPVGEEECLTGAYTDFTLLKRNTDLERLVYPWMDGPAEPLPYAVDQ